MDRLACDRMFVAVLEAGSFAGAATRYKVSSGQASKMISRLETELGVQLIKRTTRALSSTEVGQAYYERVKLLLEEHDALDISVRSASQTPAGLLRLTAPISFGTVQLSPVLLDFARIYPSIRMDVSFSDRLVDLVEEGFDVAIRVASLTDSSLMARRLCHTRIVAVASPDYLAAYGEPANLQDLATRDCIIDTNFRDPHSWVFRDAQTHRAHAVKISGRLQFSNGEACKMAAENGLGIAYLPSFIVGESIRQGKLKRILSQCEPQRLDVYALYPRARHLAVKVRALVDFLVTRFHGEPVWDRGW